MIADGHVSSLLVWRLDRLSRSLGDLILLAEEIGAAGVGLHSFSERIDLSSATGRMFYNVLGSFAQFYREQLSENVRMGMSQAMREGRWCNRPPTGYDLVDGLLRPNEDAVLVRQVFALRGDGASEGTISASTGINYSTVHSILQNRAYLGEIRHLEEWLPGVHEPIIAQEDWEASRRGRVRGRKRGRDLLSGRVVCGLCGRRMSIDQNGQGNSHYRCRHRGKGCPQPARSNRGLLRAALLGLRLLGEDRELRQAISRQLEVARTEPGHGRGRAAPTAADALRKLQDQRKKLLHLHYEGHISPEQFGEEQASLTLRIEALQEEDLQAVAQARQASEIAMRFDEVAKLLQGLDVDRLWHAAKESERRTLIDELVEAVAVHPDHLEVEISGAPRINVLFSEVGLKESQKTGVGGGVRFHDFVDTMSQDIVDTCSGGVHGSCPLRR